MTLKSKITFVIPETLQNELRMRVIQDGYGMRGKSIWITEAIKRLAEIKNFPELVHYSDDMHSLDKVETVVIDNNIRQLLENVIITIRKEYHSMEAVKSRIVRTAILQRLLRPSNNLTQVT